MSSGEKRTVVWNYAIPEEIIRYLKEMQDAIRYALQVSYRDAVNDSNHGIHSPIALRREIREWFYSRYGYARHHINPVCRTAVAMLRSYRRNHHGELRIPEVKRLVMRIDGELFRVVDGRVRITLQPNQYVWLPVNARNKHYEEYAKGRASELLITDKKVCLTFVVQRGREGKKPLGEKFIASDLNFRSMDSTKASTVGGPTLTDIATEPLDEIARTTSPREGGRSRSTSRTQIRG